MMDEPSNGLTACLSEWDDPSRKASEIALHDAISRLRDREDSSEAPLPWVAEVMAFSLRENRQEETTGRGPHFGPMVTFTSDNGTQVNIPDIKDVTPDIMEYWSGRAIAAKHPVLRARYADLVWEFSKTVTGQNPDYHMAQITVDSIVETAARNCYVSEVGVIRKLRRALSLALSLNDGPRVERVRDAIIAYEDRVAEDGSLGLWGFSYDLLVANKKVPLSEEQEQKIVGDLEKRLERITAPTGTGAPNPFAAESAALRLADYYRKKDRPDDVKRVLLRFGRTFETLSETASPLVASTWLEELDRIYRENGLRDDATRVEVMLREVGPRMAAEMKRVTVSHEVEKDKMNAYVTAMLEGTAEEVLQRIAGRYIPRKDEIGRRLDELSKMAPLSFLFSTRIQDYEGRPVATIGSLESDRDGHIVAQMAQDIQVSSVFVYRVVRGFTGRFSITAEWLSEYLFRAPIFDQSRRQIIETGLKAYLNEEYVVAIHLLVPQIEDALRRLVALSRGSTLKPSDAGGFMLKALDELLREPVVVEAFGQDAAFYFRVVLTDQRGMNLRNSVCHGVLPSQAFTPTVADRVFHILTCLALVRESPQQQG